MKQYNEYRLVEFVLSDHGHSYYLGTLLMNLFLQVPNKGQEFMSPDPIVHCAKGLYSTSF